MPEILLTQQLSRDFFLMRVAQPNNARSGQFYMLRAWDTYPVLSRPISVYDSDGESVSFLYKVVGSGTEIFSRLRAGDKIKLLGPLGNGFPLLPGRVAMVGGGVGIAPFYYAAKQMKLANPDCSIDVYLGFSDEPVLVQAYESVADRVIVDVGGFVTDKIAPERYDAVLTCGPEPMMRALYKKCGETPLYVSMENRMACGIGACLVCTCKTQDGNKKACKDGPVFEGKAVFGRE